MPRRDELDEEFDFQETVPENDITLLKTAYRNEIVLFDWPTDGQIAPELLDYKLSLINRIKQKLDIYVDSSRLESFAGDHNWNTTQVVGRWLL